MKISWQLALKKARRFSFLSFVTQVFLEARLIIFKGISACRKKDENMSLFFHFPNDKDTGVRVLEYLGPVSHLKDRIDCSKECLTISGFEYLAFNLFKAVSKFSSDKERCLIKPTASPSTEFLSHWSFSTSVEHLAVKNSNLPKKSLN